MQPPKRNYKTGLVVSRRRRAQPIQTAVNRWLEKEQEKVDAGLLKFQTWKKKESLFRIYIVPFLTARDITLTSDITITTFDDYPAYRNETTSLNSKQVITIIKEWCRKCLVKSKLIDSDVAMDRDFLPKTTIKQTDLMKNPAITPEDWKIIIDFVRDEWRHRPL